MVVSREVRLKSVDPRATRNVGVEVRIRFFVGRAVKRESDAFVFLLIGVKGEVTRAKKISNLVEKRA
jgi:hypothetical protein